MKRSLVSSLTAAILLFTQLLFLPAAHAAMIGNDAVLMQQERAEMESQVMQLLDHQIAAKVLLDYGVDEQQIGERLSQLSDEELQQLAEKADELPAGQGVVGVILAIILILVLLDLLGATNVFPAINAIN